MPLGVDQLPLVEAVEGLGHRVVVAVAGRSDRGDDVVLGEALGAIAKYWPPLSL
jgi:hypothetical protein